MKLYDKDISLKDINFHEVEIKSEDINQNAMENSIEEKLKHKDTSLKDRDFHKVEINSHDVTTNTRKKLYGGKSQR